MKKINWKILISCLIVVYLVAFIGSIFTSQNTNSEWYLSIRPSITPPSYVFPIVWNILFFLIALSLYLCWTSSIKKSTIILFFGLNFFFNILWSVFYFSLKNPLFAFLDILLLLLSTLLLLKLSYKLNKKAFYLVIPYFLWLVFATILNYLSIHKL